jgi:hypothetical protein
MRGAHGNPPQDRGGSMAESAGVTKSAGEGE